MTNVLSVISDLIVQYWGIAVLIVVGIFAAVWGNKSTATYARSRIKTLMLSAEKRAEALVLANGQAKLAWVVSQGYDMLPGVVRLFISKPLFAAFVQSEYDVAVNWAEKHVVAPVQPDVTTPVA